MAAVPIRKSEARIEQRATRIADPIEKLSYLRREMHVQEAVDRRPVWKRLSFGVAMIVTVSLLLPAPSVVSDVSSSWTRDVMFPDENSSRSADTFANVWQVEENDGSEVYSNGLRVETRLSVGNQKRFYQVLDRRTLQPSVEWYSQPVGIVFHTTESGIAPWEAEKNGEIMRMGQSLVSHLRVNRSYNFVIDRFGRVFRIVEETDAAFHSGNSIWADEKFAYLNLNSSFLGISFEAQTDPATGKVNINSAQTHAGRVLTEMLRAKYKIPQSNCVTHAQVSVNPSNGLIGYHTDWAANFPFRELGLRDNYDLPLASITDFGFDYDSLFRKRIGSKVWRGLTISESRLERDAAAVRASLTSYKAGLLERYRKLYSALKLTGAMEEGTNVNTADTE
jgi:hypothetical protein